MNLPYDLEAIKTRQAMMRAINPDYGWTQAAGDVSEYVKAATANYDKERQEAAKMVGAEMTDRFFPPMKQLTGKVVSTRLLNKGL